MTQSDQSPSAVILAHVNRRPVPGHTDAAVAANRRLVAQAVAAAVVSCDVSVDVLFSESHRAPAVEARRRIARVLRGAGWSFPEVGRVLGRHHTSVMNWLREDQS